MPYKGSLPTLNQYLHDMSHHHLVQKNGVLNTLINTAIHISYEGNWDEERTLLKGVLRWNRYSEMQID